MMRQWSLVMLMSLIALELTPIAADTCVRKQNAR